MAVRLYPAALAFALAAAMLAAAWILSPAAGAQKQGGKPDLSVNKVGGVPKQAEAGAAVTVRFTVRNRGSAKATKSKASLYLSSDRRRSKGDTKLPGTKRVPNLKPRKSVGLKLKTRLKGNNGDWYVIACASKSRREKRAANNCGASRKLVIGSSGAGAWPERYEGTFSATFSSTQDSENTGKGQTGTEDSTGSMSGELVLTRQPGDLLGGSSQPWHYESSGSLEWSGSYTSSFQETSPSYSASCSGQGTGTESVNPFAGVTTRRYAWVIPDNDLSPGGGYTTFGAEPLELELVGTCEDSEGLTSNGDRFPTFPAILPRNYDDECKLNGGRYTVKSDGSLAGTDSCRFDFDFVQVASGTHFVGTQIATWSWDLVPAD